MTSDFRLDRLDHAILDVLQADGRLAVVDLAARVGLSPTPCARRLRKLEAAGIIRGYHAEVDAALLGLELTVFVFLEILQDSRDAIQRVEDALRRVPRVVSAHRLMGRPDYVVRLLVADLDEYEQLYIDHLATLPGVRTVQSAPSMKPLVDGVVARIDV
jgi:Lrp/AsnC family leucine-responsive transcriptional regulator